MSLDEAAKVLGVHYMTAYRYVRQGKLAATRVKGVWQVTPHALGEFQRRADARKENPRASEDSRRTGDYVGELLRCLLNADGGGAWGVIQRAIDAGNDMEEVYLEILAPAMAEIGSQWRRGEIDIAVEHQATSIAIRLVGQLSPRCVRRGRRRGEVLIGGPAGERHSLPLAMLADLLRLEGWEVFDLGADTPANSFVHAASKINNLTAVGVSVTTPESIPGAVEVVKALRQAMADEVPVVLGGSAIRDLDHARELGGDFFAVGARGFVDFLDGLASGRTGRPTNGKSGNGKSENGKSENGKSGNGKSGNPQN
jgi:excisionase family DNA binding protein